MQDYFQAFAMTTVHHNTHHHTGHHHTKQHHTGHHGHHTGPTQEPVEHENFNFRYDPHSVSILLPFHDKTANNCSMYN